MSARRVLCLFRVTIVDFSREVYEYIRRNKWVLVFLSCLAFATYFIKLSNYSISIDNEVALNDFDGLRKSWIMIGRWALALMSYVVNCTGYNPFFSTFVTVILFLVMILLLSFYLGRLTGDRRYEKVILATVGVVCLTSPVFATMFNFSMQGIEVAFGLIATVLSATVLDFTIFSSQMGYRGAAYVFVAVILAFSMGVYQSLATLFVTVVVVFFLMRQLFDKNGDLKDTVARVLKILGVFAVAYLLNVLMSKIVMSIFGISKTDYLTSQIMWGQLPLIEVIKTFLIFVKSVVFPANSLTGAYNYTYLYAVILSVVLVIMLFRRSKCKAIIPALCIVVILLSPFLVALLGGNEVPARTMLNLPVAVCTVLVAFYCVGTKNEYFRGGLLVIVFLIGITQFRTTVDLLNSDLVRYEEDKTLLQSVFSRIGAMDVLSDTDDFSDKVITFVGVHEVLSTGVNARADAMVASFFAWDNTSPLGSNYRINGFAKTLGYRYVKPNIEDVELARNVCAKSVKFPAGDSIKSINGSIIVCLK